MNNVVQVKKILEELVKSVDSPVYVICSEIISFLEKNPNQRNLTIGGLRAGLQRVEHDDRILIEAAYTLTAHPFLALDVKYKLYDEEIEEVIEELEHETYMGAIKNGCFIDDEGNDLAIDALNSRVFPYFINQLTTNVTAKSHTAVKFD